MAAGKLNLQANDGKLLSLTAPDGMSNNKEITPAGDFNYIFKSTDYNANIYDFIYCDTKPVAQVDEITITVANNTSYTITINGTNFTYTSDADATNDEIVSGLISTINGGNEPITASGTTTVIITANEAGIPFSISVSTNLSINTITENKVGSFTITLPANPNINDKIGLLDNTSNFDKNNLTIARNGNTIMGVDEDMVINTKNISLELIFNGNDWRIK